MQTLSPERPSPTVWGRRELRDLAAETVRAALDAEALVGVAAAGLLDYEGDLDILAYELNAGQLYQIDVELDALSDSLVTLYDGEGASLVTNDDRPDSQASRIFWEAARSGRHDIEVSAAGLAEDRTGSYSLSIVAR